MNKTVCGMSGLAVEAGFGTRVWSYYGYLAARYYHQILGVFVALIVFFSLRPYLPLRLTLLPIGLYMLYLVVRHSIPARLEASFYDARVQFGRAQLGIGVLFIILWLTRSLDSRLILWILYLPSLMIISRHCSTPVYVLTVGQVSVMMIIVRWNGSGFPLYDPEFIARWLSLGLIAFVMHYLVRNIDARNHIIRNFEAIEALSERSDNGRLVPERWLAALETYLDLIKGTCGAIWLCDHDTRRIRPLSGFRYCLGQECPLESECETAPLDLSADHPISWVARTGQPTFCQSSTVPSDNPLQLGQWPLTPVCPLPAGIHSRIIVPIVDPRAAHEKTLGVLCIDFTRNNTPRPYLWWDYYEFLSGLARRVRPILHHVQQIEELQALQDIGQRLSSNLKLETILDDALEAVMDRLGFEFATVSLVDPAREEIRTVMGRNVPQEWTRACVHSLHSQDIQSDIVRRGRQEVLSGWDPRFDPAIWEKFNHNGLIRVFTPIIGLDEEGRSRVRGTIEAGYWTTTRDEISDEQRRRLGILARHLFGALENAEFYEKTRRRAENLANLHRIGWEVTMARQDTSAVLDEVGARLLAILGEEDLVMIYRYNCGTGQLEPPRVFGDIIGKHPLRAPSAKEGIVADILSQRDPVYIPDVRREPRLVGADPEQGHRTFTQRQEIVSFAGVPMIASGEIMGVLCVDYRSRHTFSTGHRQVIEITAQFAAVALHNAETNELIEELITSRERMELADQLHHSLSQYLPSIRIFAETALVQLTTSPDRIARQLENIIEAATKAVNVTRVNIFDLNAKSPAQHKLHEVLADYTEEMRGFFGLEIDLQIDPEAEAQLALPVARELLIVCQESIGNTAKHAAATCIEVGLRRVDHHIHLYIRDNGRGFDMAQLDSRGHRGLTMIRERIKRLNGTADVFSRPGAGTVIKVEVPLA